MNGRILLILWWLALVIILISGDGFWEFHILELLTFIGVVAGTLWAAFSLARTWWGRFELRFLNPNEEIDPQHEKRSCALRLLPHESYIPLSIRPRTRISSINRITFSAFDNRNYPMRLLSMKPGQKRLSTSSLKATKYRWQEEDGGWGEWRKTQIFPHRTSDNVARIFVKGSRQVIEVCYVIDASLAGFDGILGFEIQYEDGGGFDHAYVNSKFYVDDTGRKPLTFKLRRVHSGRPCPKVTPPPASQSEIGNNEL